MEIIEKEKVEKYLKNISDFKKDNIFYDCHCHPFDVFLHDLEYNSSIHCKDLVSISNDKPEKPKLSFIKLEENNRQHPIISKLDEAFYKSKVKKIYGHTGKKIYEEAKKLSLIDKVLLLPVTLNIKFVEKNIKSVHELFGKDDDYLIAGSIPYIHEVKNVDEIITNMKEKYDIKALKLHPPIMNIDLNEPKNINWIENVFSACSKLKLPMVIHSGKSYLVRHKKAIDYGSLKRLCKLNWKNTKHTVVLAHGGAYGCDLNEVQNDIMPILKNVLKKNENVVIDISGLEFKIMYEILKEINSESIIFGSDALYYEQWSAIVKLVAALDMLMVDVEEEFFKIVSTNPKKYIFSLD